VRNIRYFRRDYPDATVVKLEQNYRSSKRIVAGALGVISRSSEREPKELWTANDDGEPIRIVAARDERDEAAFVVDAVARARAEGGDLKEIAVFYRIRRHQVLRPRRGEGRARVPPRRGEPGE
jgi:DNA helicase-2/ATP-dependent DNA helicase PcrA